jgi:glycosyltransferase involved in cell wall biosynthesis
VPLVSVIIPTRRRHGLLARALASVVGQTHGELDVIVVDDNDPGEQVAEDAGLRPLLSDPRVRIVAGSGARSAAAARNRGLQAARGEWITYLDDDDAFRPAKVAVQLACAEATGAALVLCGACFHLRGRIREKPLDRDRYAGDDVLTVAVLGAPYFFHRRKPGLLFDEGLNAGEDAHYAHALLAACHATEVAAVPAVLVDVYQDGPARPRTNLQGVAGWRATRRVWWRFGPRFSPAARRLYVLRGRVTRAKLEGDVRGVLGLAPALLRAGGWTQARFLLNAAAVGLGFFPGRWRS